MQLNQKFNKIFENDVSFKKKKFQKSVIRNKSRR